MTALLLVALLACGGDSDEPVDADGDGFLSTDDCDDANEAVNEDANEVCNGVDDNCDERVDEPQAIDAHTWYVDADGDGFGDGARFAKACDEPGGWVANGDDCDDDDPAVGACP